MAVCGRCVEEELSILASHNFMSFADAIFKLSLRIFSKYFFDFFAASKKSTLNLEAQRELVM